MKKFILNFSCLLSVSICAESKNEELVVLDDIPEVHIVGARQAFEYSASVLESPLSILRNDPQVVLQTRGIAEVQSDIVVRGSMFEHTGVKIGAVTILDPQTGHYTGNLPFASQLLESPILKLGVENAISGFNANVATLDFGLKEITTQRALSAGFGTDDFRLGQVYLGQTWDLGERVLGGSVSYGHSKGDGTEENGDHDRERFNAQLQLQGNGGQTDLIFAHQDTFYGWPGAYTGFASLPETDRTKTKLVLVNHRHQQTDGNWFEVGAYYRSLDDDYDFNRTTQESDAPGSFDHKTKSLALGLNGERALSNVWDLAYNLQWTGDKLVRSTDLLGGDFVSRDYVKAALLPSREWSLRSGRALQLKAGANYLWTNRDGGYVAPQLSLALLNDLSNSNKTIYSASYSSNSQVPGYTALKSGVSGLFGGNPNLGREKSHTFELSRAAFSENSQNKIAVFYRQDEDLVDWTYSSDSVFARQANAVDLDVFGLELFWQKQFHAVNIGTGYTYLNKDETYQNTPLNSAVDASYYALNYARHRLVANADWAISPSWSLSVNAELLEAFKNPLRQQNEQDFNYSSALVWQPKSFESIKINLIGDNLNNSDFQQFPGTPAYGRTVALRVDYIW